MQVRRVQWDRDLAAVQSLLWGYVDEHGAALGAQDFQREFAELPQRYGRPDSAMVVAEVDDEVVGCAVVKRMRDADGELKRMVVAPSARGLGVGRALAVAGIEEARILGLRRLLLDTTPEMAAARALYTSLGFVECEPYYPTSPLRRPVFMALELAVR